MPKEFWGWKVVALMFISIAVKNHPLPWRGQEEFGRSVVRDRDGVVVGEYSSQQDANRVIRIAELTRKRKKAS